MSKPYSLKASDKNLTSKASGIIRLMLENTRSGNTPSLAATFALFRSVTNIDPKLEEATPGAKGDIKWHQAIRNVAKVHKNPKHNNKLMMSGELFALEDGGFALPNKVPKGRTVIGFPISKGLDVPVVKKKKVKKKKRKVGERAVVVDYAPKQPSERNEIAKVVAGLRRVVKNVRDEIRDAVVHEIYSQIDEGTWFFEGSN